MIVEFVLLVVGALVTLTEELVGNAAILGLVGCGVVAVELLCEHDGSPGNKLQSTGSVVFLDVFFMSGGGILLVVELNAILLLE